MPALADAWIQARSTAVPADLRVRVRAAIRGVHGGEDIPATLALAAESSLSAALERPLARAAAADLLAADSLLTWACEAVAEAGAPAPAERWIGMARRLAVLLPR